MRAPIGDVKRGFPDGRALRGMLFRNIPYGHWFSSRGCAAVLAREHDLAITTTMTTVQDGPGAPFSGLPRSQHGLGMRRGRGHVERSRLSRLVRTRGAICGTQIPTRPLRMAQDRRSPSDCVERRGVSEPRSCRGPLCAYGRRYRLSPHLAFNERRCHTVLVLLHCTVRSHVRTREHV